MEARNKMRRVVIIGGGLGGLLTCKALVERGMDPEDVVVIDDRGPRRGSDNPGAMMHPFPGRLLAPKQGVIEAYQAASTLLDDQVEAFPSVASFHGEIVRPLVEGAVGEAFESSWREHRDDYPERISSRLVDRAQLQKLGPFSDDIERAIVYGPAYCIDLAGWLDRLTEALQEGGVRFVAGRAEAVERRPTSWRVHLGGESIGARRCVLAVGTALDDWFPELNIQPTGGALLVVDAGGLELEAAVSAGGHIAPLGPDRWVAGATWWHDDEFETVDDEQAGDAIVERVRHLVPQITDMERVRVWRGVRAVHANDRRPLVGRVAAQKGLYVCAGFGSKGLLWAPLMARAMAGLIADGNAPPAFANAQRLARRWWRPGPSLAL